MGKEILHSLNSIFGSSVKELLWNCKTEGFDLIPFFGLRSIQVQAKFWRQSRTGHQVTEAIAMLERNNAHYLAKVLKSVGPQHGKWVTNALPGQSEHNHGLAIDCFVEEDGKAVWDAGHPGYKCYAEQAKNLGLTAGRYWKKKDAVHVQQSDRGVLETYTWKELDEIFSPIGEG